jgi:hypothetical protein
MVRKQELDIKDSITPSAVFEGPSITQTQKEAAKKKLQELMKEESRLVKGIFQFFETPGGSVRIQQKKYPSPTQGGIPAFDKVMTDGMEYEIPLWVARWLNGIDVSAHAIKGRINSCAYPVHGFLSSNGQLSPSVLGSVPGQADGIPVPIVGVNKWKRRFGFQSLEFAGAV